MRRAWVLVALAAAGCATQIAPGDGGGGGDAGDADRPDSATVDTIDVRSPVDVGADIQDVRQDVPIDRAVAETGSDVIDVGNADTGFDSADVTCPPNAPVRCGGVCVGDTQTNPARCGDSCTVCEVPVHGAAGCDNGSCGIACNPGFLAQGGQCVDYPAPRLVHPMTNSRVSVRNPMLRWETPTGVNDVHVTVCADRACTRVQTEFDATGTSQRVPADLPAGVWFWRTQSVDRGVRSLAVSATWQLHTPAASGPVEWAWAGQLDMNGDGLDDFVVGGEGVVPGDGALVFLGNGGRDLSHPVALAAAIGDGTQTPMAPVNASDANGDGFTDVYLEYRRSANASMTDRFNGSDSTTAFTLGQRYDTSAQPMFAYVPPPSSSGDFDRDGYGDAFVNSGNPATGVYTGAW